MSDELKQPCPWCGSVAFDDSNAYQIRENGKVWMGTHSGPPSSVSVWHWCAPTPGQPSRGIERVGRDHASAIAAWNRRSPTGGQEAAYERAARVCDEYPQRDPAGDGSGYWAAEECAATIRKLRETGK